MHKIKNITENYKEKIIKISRNAKVVKGGRIFSFSVLVALGNKNGKIGIGRGKAREVPTAIQKAVKRAKKNLIFIRLNKNTLFHSIVSVHGATKVIMLPSKLGSGIIAGGAMRAIFKVLGIKDICSKCIGSTNANNVVLATLNGLIKMSNPDTVMMKLNKI